MNIFIFGLIISLLYSIRNLLYSRIVNTSSNDVIMLLVICSIFCGLVYFIFNLRLNINIIINGLKFFPLSLLYLSIAVLLNLFAFMHFFKSFFHKERTTDTNIITISIVSALPIIITGFIYYIIGIEKYKIQTYISILVILLGNMGLIRYWSK